ncbi:MAG: hypothetical protein P4L71_16315 [Acetobacteraceae bacterium]|nr:hypothetical protein [Acetobacteraceae bacterium]
MSESGAATMDVTFDLVVRLLFTLERLEAIARRMHPPALPEVVAPLGAEAAALRRALDAFLAMDWPDAEAEFRDRAEYAAETALAACEGLQEAATALETRARPARGAMHQVARAVEAAYPLAAVVPAVSRWFLEPSRRSDDALLDRLAPRSANPPVGVLHADNETDTRGGFSLYVPESYDPSVAAPLIMALHGGSGHGRLFLWNWVREARSRGAILVAPTALGATWSMMAPEADNAHLAHILALVSKHYRIDPAHRLLTGMSDGGTFTMVSGMHEGSPFTHLAPAAASIHPLLLSMADPARLRGLPIYMIHGAIDWLFPVETARDAQQSLLESGARLTYREIEDLSHAYPRDENTAILDWLLES